ncbi:MAG: hypothetical protein FJ137_13160 [Deltaproteobacteria bacterium]|nr:hypothetical protein [Deltaproteobacteria bacterium]
MLTVLGLATAGVADVVTSVDLAQVERDVVTASAEAERLEAQYQSLPNLFSTDDREDRATWGSIYHLNREFDRAALALFGAVEPRDGETSDKLAQDANYGEALYLLADSLLQLGNEGAAKQYFERLLILRNGGYQDEAIQRLMEIAARAQLFGEVDRYFAQYVETVGGNIPGKVRYLRARSLFLAKRDAEAGEQLAKVGAGEPFDQRARYLRAAIATRKGDLTTALAVFDELIALKPVAREDAAVRELAHLGRGRILYELDRLDESVDAYQAIDYDSPYLTSMLYELTLTFVRRGQLALRGQKDDGLTDLQRRERARSEYQRALRQLDDLRSLDPDGQRSADIEMLAANLRLQRHEFEQAEAIFEGLLVRFRSVDSMLQGLIGDTSIADKVLADILALEKDPRASLQSPLPLIAAQRAARLPAVAQAVAVFKELQESRVDVAATREMLDRLDEQLSPSNPGRAELFKPLRSAVERSLSLANSLLEMRARAVAVERSLARPGADERAKLDQIAVRRERLEQQVDSLPRTAEAYAARRERLKERANGIDRSLHELELANKHLRAAATSVEWLAGADPDPARVASFRTRARELAAELAANDRRLVELQSKTVAVRAAVGTAGGRGSAEDQLRRTLEQTYAEERAVLATVRDTGRGPDAARVDALYARIDEVDRRNTGFRERLDAGVEQRLSGVRAMLSAERDALAAYDRALAGLDSRAAALRSGATADALEHVREDVGSIVLRGDVGLIDSAFSRKQAETEMIGALQRARAAELTDLTQAYADLTKDEQP